MNNETGWRRLRKRIEKKGVSMEKVTGTMTVQRPGSTLPVSERWLSAVIGLLTTLYGLRQKGSLGFGMLAAGSYLLYRSVTGRCHVYELLGVTGRPDEDLAPVEKKPPSVRKGDEVTESSWESFPTSDPPSWTLGREQVEQQQ